MQDSSVQEKKVILIILGLLILSVFLSGMKRYYPNTADAFVYIQPETESSDKSSSNQKTINPTGLICINTATSSELLELSGIGPVIAERIIDYRNLHGGFKTKEDLLNIKGIGSKKLEKLQNQIRITGSDPENGKGFDNTR